MSSYNSKGGRRPRSGRPSITGQPAQAGAPWAIAKSITLTAEQWQLLTALGDGNASAGVRILVERHKAQQ